MNMYHVFKDGTLIATTPTRESAVDMIRSHQSRETHFMLRASFSIIYGEQEFILYETERKRGRKKEAK